MAYYMKFHIQPCRCFSVCTWRHHLLVSDAINVFTTSTPKYQDHLLITQRSLTTLSTFLSPKHSVSSSEVIKVQGIALSFQNFEISILLRIRTVIKILPPGNNILHFLEVFIVIMIQRVSILQARVCPTRYRTRHFFNNFTTNEDIATKFEADDRHITLHFSHNERTPVQTSLQYLHWYQNY